MCIVLPYICIIENRFASQHKVTPHLRLLISERLPIMTEYSGKSLH